MVFEQKEFTPIKGYEDAYFICKSTTEVLSIKNRRNTKSGTFKILKQVNNSKSPSNNYLIVTLVDSDGKRVNKPIHRIMAETFLPNPESKAHVNHIDGNKLNNNLSNLEWATEKENSQHAVDTGLTTYDHCKKQVHQYTLSGDYLKSYSSDAEAELHTGVAKQNISKNTLGKRPQAGGYQWSRERKASIDQYQGRPIINYLQLTDTKLNITTKEYCSLAKLAETLNLSRYALESNIRKNGYYSDEVIIIKPIYFN